MARVKIEPSGKVLIAVVVVGALLLLFLRVRASINKRASEAPSHQSSSIMKPPPMLATQSGMPGKPVKEKEAVSPEPNSEPVKIFFDFNRANINKNVYCIFDKIDEMVNRTGLQNIRIMVEGNADSIGPSWYNVNLSRTRAAHIADSLSRRLGIPLKDIELVANGSARPAASNKTSKGRAENRRSEVHIFR